MDAEWGSWINISLQELNERHLTRVLRPLVATQSAVQVQIHTQQLDAWLQGAPACNDPQTLPTTAAALSEGPCASAQAAARASAGTAATSSGSRQQQQQQQQQLDQQLDQQPDQRQLPLQLFGLNDYMGLSTHPDVCKAAAAAALTAGMGPRSSALVCGFTTEHRMLELELARLKGTEDCLLFPTGYAANMAVLTVLAAPSNSSSSDGNEAGTSRHQAASPSHQAASHPPEVVVFSDELNHASIIDGARLASRNGAAGAVRLEVYRHNDLDHLEQLLGRYRQGTRKLVVTDGLFSMDGDFADLRGLRRLRRRHGFLLVVDDAHATLACGEHGGGTAEMQGALGAADVCVGTLSKAFGCHGGFAACSAVVRALLLNRGRGVVFSTAAPLPVVAAARAALRVSQRESWRRRHLWALVHRLGTRLGVPAHSPVIPIVIGPEAATMEAARQLLARGFHVGAIRPPTVPPGTCRLRISLSAAHSVEAVDALADALLSLVGRGSAGGGAAAGGGPPTLTHLKQPAPWTAGWQARQRELDEREGLLADGDLAAEGPSWIPRAAVLSRL